MYLDRGFDGVRVMRFMTKTRLRAVIACTDAFLRRRLTDHQIGIAYRYLTRIDPDVLGGLRMATYGGRVNTVPPDATASAQ